MIVVIQCAARKREDAGFLKTREGKPVLFVADPPSAPTNDDYVYARPDDASDHGGSWRDVLVRFNEDPGSNPLSLCPAFELYANETYRALAKQFGIDKTYILSAGWGLIPASFLTPCYDITFTTSAEDWKRRKKRDAYAGPVDAPRRYGRPSPVSRRQGLPAAFHAPDSARALSSDRVLQFRDAAGCAGLSSCPVCDHDADQLAL